MSDQVPTRRKLRVERLPGPDMLAGIAAEWDLLDRQTLPRTPFTSPAYIIPWWKHFRRRQMLLRDEFFCHIVRGGDGRLVAIAPLMCTSAPGIGPQVLRLVQFFGADPGLTEIRGLICRPDDHPSVVEALVEYFLARRDEWDVFRWTGLRHPVETYMGPRSPSPFVSGKELPDYVVELRGSWEDLREQLSFNMRKNLRKQYKFLEREGLAFALRVTEHPGGVAAALARFLALHAARAASAADMIVHANKFVQLRARAFFAEYLHSVAERGELRIFELEIGGATVASRPAILLGSDLYLHLAGYDPAWKAYSVMTVLMTEMFKWALANGVERINLSTGRDQSKARWKPREVLFHNALQVSPTPRARAAFPVFAAYEALRRTKSRVPAAGPERDGDNSPSVQGIRRARPA